MTSTLPAAPGAPCSRAAKASANVCAPFAPSGARLAISAAGPRRTLVGMALVARVRHAKGHGPIGTRDAERVVVPRIVHHVRGGGHVARRARGARRAGLVVVMRGRIVGGRRVALRARRVPWGP